MKLLRWGRAEYEDQPFDGLPTGVEVIEDASPQPDFASVDVLVVPSKRRVTAEVVAQLSRCRLVLTTTSGHDHLDLIALKAAGIPAARLPLARRDAVVETALGMILSLTRRLGVLQAAATEGRWVRGELRQVGATTLGTVGVVGVGVIGQKMVQVLEVLGARVLRCDPCLPDGNPLEQLLEEAAVITLHCALTPQTTFLFDEKRVAAMQAGAILVNTARGRLVAVEAAVQAVHRGHLSGLGLDVFPQEPTPLQPLVHPRILLSPHAAGWHPGLGRACAEGVAAAVHALQTQQVIPYLLSI